MEYAIIWLALFVILIFMEIATMGLTTIWFAVGAMVSFFADLMGANIYAQLVIFVVVSTLLLVTTRPIVKKMLMEKRVKTNVDALVGQIGVVTVAIDNLQCSGAVQLNGVEWTARSVDNALKFSVGEKVRVKEINGVKLIVEVNN